MLFADNVAGPLECMRTWGMVRSPWSDKKVSERAGHNSEALPTAATRTLWVFRALK